VFPPGTVWYYPGEDGRPENFGVIRFTVPANAAGNYRLETSVRSVYEGSLSHDTDFHVVKNGAEFLASRSSEFRHRLHEPPGSCRWGYHRLCHRTGADGSQYASGLKIRATLNLDGVVTEVPPLIVSQPQSQTALAGATVTFSVAAEGTAPLAYQWRFNGMDMPGEMNPTLTLTNVQAASVGQYSVRVSNTAGSALSLEADLSITTPPSPGDYDPRDFSAAHNPSGVWSFGWSPSVGGALRCDSAAHFFGRRRVDSLMAVDQLSDPGGLSKHLPSTVSIAGGQGVFRPAQSGISRERMAGPRISV
jgi:hypothetical protein